jgi:hypothetical protein
MAKRRIQVVVPDYPRELFKAVDWNDRQAVSGCLTALAYHYDIISPFDDEEVDFLVSDDDEMLERWKNLTLSLLRDFVPAFRVKRRGGTPKQQHTRLRTIDPHAHQARLVQMVFALRDILRTKGRPSSKFDAFKELVRILKANPAPLWRYGKLTKASSFAQAWKDIPHDVRKNPDRYIRYHPVRDHRRGDIIVFKPHDWRYLPPVPTQLEGSGM